MKDPLAKLPGYALRRASVTMMDALSEGLKDLDLKFTESTALVLIGANPGIRQADLVEMLAIQRPNMVPLVARLEMHGWVERAAVDGRSFGLTLTPAGEALLNRVWVVVNDLEQRLISHVRTDQVEIFHKTLTAIWQNW